MTDDRDRAAVRTAVLLSGSGRTLANLLARIGSADLPLDVVGVVSSRPGVRGLDVAAEAGIPSAVFRRKDYPGIREHSDAVNAWLEPLAPRLIVLAGYLCTYLQPDWFTGPVVNIHPALLPKFGGEGYYGDGVHLAVLEAGEKVTGCTVHLVDDQYDHGRILGRQEVPVLSGDDVHSLAARVFAAECELYPRVLADLARTLL